MSELQKKTESQHACSSRNVRMGTTHVLESCTLCGTLICRSVTFSNKTEHFQITKCFTFLHSVSQTLKTNQSTFPMDILTQEIRLKSFDDASHHMI